MNLLADHPEVLDETPGLPEAMKHARDYYEAHDGVPDEGREIADGNTCRPYRRFRSE